ncbi:MAG: hypothetical protein P9L94_13755 [Candidatus Hinthialibacter antarcticus]|nr:hypothetical protein [Candidatus Hinthialibacter antarcticus]
MSIVRLFVTLKVPGNTARSALSALQRRMGYGKLSELGCSDFWELDFPNLSVDEARQTVERLAQKTAFFVNPNKHRWAVQCADAPGNDVIQPQGDAQVSVLVCDREDGRAEAVLEALMKRDAPERPARLTRGVWWDLRFDGASDDEIKKMTEEMAVASTRQTGLFANPHYQTHRLFFA